eukprot:RCo002515
MLFNSGMMSVCLLPSSTMLLCSLATVVVNLTSNVQAALQNLAGGVLLLSVASELLPMLLKTNSSAGTLCVLLGFFAAMGLMYGVKSLTAAPQPEVPEPRSLSSARLQRHILALRTTMKRVSDKRTLRILQQELEDLERLVSGHGTGGCAWNLPFSLPGGGAYGGYPPPSSPYVGGEGGEVMIQVTPAVGAALLETPSDVLCGGPPGPSSKPGASAEARLWEWLPTDLPFSLCLAVLLDAWVDGLLLGVTLCVSPHSGLMMGVATAIEMGIVGLAYGATCLSSSASFRVKLIAMCTHPAA